MSKPTVRNATSRKEHWGHTLMLLLLLCLPGVAAHAAEVFATDLQRPFGSTVGPGGDLYVADAGAGAIVRIDSRTGETSTYANGLPLSPLINVAGLGGVMDVTFVDGVAYALVTVVGWDVGGSDVVGIYRLEESGAWSVVADIGEFSANNPPSFFDLPTGLQYGLQSFRGGFLVTDGNHNRVLHVSRDGTVTEAAAFGNVVPTGLEVRGNWVYVALAGPEPYLPEQGKVLRLDPRTWEASELASGAPLLVDVEFGRGTQLLALSQGDSSGGPPGAPALSDSGALVVLDGNGGFTTIEDQLNLPTSMVVIRNAAYIVSLDGNVYRVPDVTGPPFGN